MSGALTDSQESAVAQTLSALDDELRAAFYKVAGTLPTLGAGNVKDAVMGNLQTDYAKFQRLGADLLDSARAGTLGWERWVNIAELCHQDIAYQTGLTGEWSLSGVLRGAAEATYEDVGDRANNPLGWPWYFQVAAGAVVLYVGVQVLNAFTGAANATRSLRRRSR